MDRKEFLSMLGIGTVAFIGASCLSGCTPPDSTVPAAPTGVDFTINLSQTANSALLQNGGYIYSNGIIVARTTGGAYVAVSQACTHQGTTVYYDPGANDFHCPNHGSNFATNGGVINGPANTALTVYHTSLNGTSLRVYS